MKKKTVFTVPEKKNILILSGVCFFRMFCVFMVLPVFSLLAKDLNFSNSFLIGVAFGAYGLTQGIFQIPFGVWSDRTDRRRVLLVALFIFTTGCLLAALTDNIYVMIAARLLQGMGAVSSVIFALIADLTREEVRTRANAILGMSIGSAFGLAFFAAPFIGAQTGINGIFGISAFLGSFCFLLVFFSVPSFRPKADKPLNSPFEMIRTALKIKKLYPIYLGSFVCGVGLSINLFITPLIAVEHGLEKYDMWKVYLPMLLLGACSMVPSAIYAEVKNKFKQVMFIGAFIITLSSITGFIPDLFSQPLVAILFPLYLFFIGFNIFEPIFPSLVTRMSTPETKGTSSGVFNFFQFIGHFCGALTAGSFYDSSIKQIYIIFFMLSLFFILLLFFFSNPQKRIAK